jgi:osmoprotectant transport system substrate-binding protein
MKRLTAWFVVLLLALTLAACGDDGDDAGSGEEGGGGSEESKGRIVVGSKLDTEAQLLGQMLAETLKAKGYEVEKKIPLGNTQLTRGALEKGEIDIYWEFTSSGLSILGEKPIGDPQQAYARAKELDAKNGITWLPSAAMNDTYALAVKEGGPIAAKTLSELATYVKGKPGAKICVDPEGGFREDVLPIVKTSYGIEFTNVQQLGYELIPPAVKDNQCEIGIVYSTAALIVKNDLRVLEDDKKAFGAYTPAPTIKADKLRSFPTLERDLADLTKALDTATITRLNAEVDVDKKPAEQVAKDFLADKNIT